MRKKFILTMWRLLGASIVIIFLLIVAIWNGWIGYMPDMEDLQNPVDRYATQVYTADGKLMGVWNKDNHNRIHVDYNAMSPYLIQALVATEDARFYEHSGVDFVALSRAIVKRGIMGQKSAGGGSTITQQLAKQLYSSKAHSTFERLLQKPIEWIIAIKLERNFTKEEIITMYLNYFDFLHNAVGIKSAANTYFHKEPKNLTIEESALLIGLCKNPSYFNPVRHPERCQERRNVVLAQMEKEGYLSHSDYLEYSDKPIKLDFQRDHNNKSYGTYLREYLRQYMMADKPERSTYPEWNQAQYVTDSINWKNDPLYGWCNKNFKKDGSPYNIYEDGLKVYTTLDSRMQKYAEEAVYENMALHVQPYFNQECKGKRFAPFANGTSKADIDRIINRTIRQSARYHDLKAAGMSHEEIMKTFKEKTEMNVFTYHGSVDTVMTPLDSIWYYKKFMRTGFVSMDPKTGAVKAYVGGIDFNHFKYDMASLGRRQVGSTIKPFLYSLAMDNGYSPCDQVPCVHTTYYDNGTPWRPRGGAAGMVTLKWGLQRSNNLVAAYLINELGAPKFIELLRKYGISSPNIKPTLTLALGSCEIPVTDMVSAYTAFVNHGIRCAPMFVSKIEDGNGNVIATFDPVVNEVISEESAYKMLVIMQAVVNGGTGSRIRSMGITAQMGGKTGTTNDNSDAWFMGVTPNLVSGCWVGGEDRSIRFASGAYGQGAAAALPLYAYFMKRVYADETLPYSQKEVFDLPAGYDGCANDLSGYDSGNVEEVFE